MASVDFGWIDEWIDDMDGRMDEEKEQKLIHR
jgi:hypothetical protein